MYRFAVIGRNFVVDDLLRAAAQVPDVQAVGVYSRRQDTAQAFADRHGMARTYTQIEALAADNDLDFVYIASPNLCHEAQTVALLRAGKHVLVEKPAAPSLDAFRRMQQAAAESGCVLMEAMMPAHMPALAFIRTCLDEIAPVRFASFPYCQYSSRYDKFKRGIVENAFDPTLANGALMDIGIYCVAMMTALFGMPDRIDGQCLFLPQSIDGCGSITASYDGLLCSLRYSKITDGDLSCEIQGENGCIRIDRASRPRTVSCTLRSGETRTFTTPDDILDMTYELRDFVRLLGGADPAPFQEITARSLAVTDTARRVMGVDFQKHSSPSTNPFEE